MQVSPDKPLQNVYFNRNGGALNIPQQIVGGLTDVVVCSYSVWEVLQAWKQRPKSLLIWITPPQNSSKHPSKPVAKHCTPLGGNIIQHRNRSKTFSDSKCPKSFMWECCPIGLDCIESEHSLTTGLWLQSPLSPQTCCCQGPWLGYLLRESPLCFIQKLQEHWAPTSVADN